MADRTVQHIHSPLLNKLIHKLNETKQITNKSLTGSPYFKLNITTQTAVVNISTGPELTSYLVVNTTNDFEYISETNTKVNTTATPYCPEIPPHSREYFPKLNSQHNLKFTLFIYFCIF